jgi:hypothetical protein
LSGGDPVVLKTPGRIRETVSLFPQSQNKRESKIIKEREREREREKKARVKEREREKERGGRLFCVANSTKLTNEKQGAFSKLLRKCV